MSIPACAWASEKGRELRLTCPERVTLWQLAERANFKGFCWPSVVQLMADTGLARQTVLTVVHGLASLGLIRIEKQGQRHVYHVLRPVYNKTVERSKSRPATGLNLDHDRSKTEPVTGLKTASNRSKSDTGTGLKSLPGTLKEPKKEPGAREGAPPAPANGREPENKNFDLEGGDDAAQPSGLAKGPDDGTTCGSREPPAESLDTTEFYAELDKRRVVRSTVPAATAPGEVIHGEILPPDAAVGPQVTANLVRATVRAMKTNYPARASSLDRWEQADALAAKPSWPTVPPEQIRAMRCAQGITVSGPAP